ncbi:V-type proton ATPase subunit S1-like [Neocloeon triangulifer]|uniref:V-type proton ATPase subunit S1-like n=1 Tax=Neocloeon triangulifer TaxID=2078957 RepID=UPI00286F3B6F|nr:V-type proton ATPase subunit S1-like [Neocloeon triangulifer]
MAAHGQIFTSLLVIFLGTSLIQAEISPNFDVSNVEESVPVLLWQSPSLKGQETTVKESPKKAAAGLEKVDDELFSTLLKEIITAKAGKPLILLFLEENLSSEDFLTDEEKVFPHLQKIINKSKDTVYLPSVVSPTTALKELDQNGYTWLPYNSDELPESESIILVINLDDAQEGESRPEMLSRHDQKINTIYNSALKVFNNVLGIYTSRYSSWNSAEVALHRVRRQAVVPIKVGNGTIFTDKDKKVVLHMNSAPILIMNNNKPMPLSDATTITVDEKEDLQTLSIVFSTPSKVTLRLRFPELYRGYWNLGEVEVENGATPVVLSLKNNITVPRNFSYHCSAFNTTFRDANNSLIFTDFQVEPYNYRVGFSDPYDCSYFFTIPILSGLFCTGFLAIIMAWGLSMILDIKTNDRYDDPKGKTITVTATD